jgi:hypothetical protein
VLGSCIFNQSGFATLLTIFTIIEFVKEKLLSIIYKEKKKYRDYSKQLSRPSVISLAGSIKKQRPFFHKVQRDKKPDSSF